MIGPKNPIVFSESFLLANFLSTFEALVIKDKSTDQPFLSHSGESERQCVSVLALTNGGEGR